MQPHRHKVSYHEMDKMGIVHHSNYVKWMEDARVDFLEQIGAPFTAIEALGIVSPVVGIEVEYKTPCVFGDEIVVTPVITKFNGVRLEVAYVMENAATGGVVVTAQSRHCFTKDGKVCNLKKVAPEIHAALKGATDD